MIHFFNKTTPEAVMSGVCPNNSEGYHSFHSAADPRYLVCSCGYVHTVEMCSCCGKDYAFCPCSIYRDGVCKTHMGATK